MTGALSLSRPGLSDVHCHLEAWSPSPKILSVSLCAPRQLQTQRTLPVPMCLQAKLRKKKQSRLLVSWNRESAVVNRPAVL